MRCNKLHIWLLFVSLLLCTASFALTASSFSAPARSAEQNYLESVYRQFQALVVTTEAADRLYFNFIRIHVEPIREAYQLLVAPAAGRRLDGEQARRVMQTVRPIVQVDTLRRMVAYQVILHNQDANQFYSSRRSLLETMASSMPEEYAPVLRSYASLFDDIYATYAREPLEAIRLNKSWCEEADDIYSRELQLYGQPPPLAAHKLFGVTILRNSFDQPICGAATLAMGLEATLKRKFNLYEIANTIGWDGTTGPMMWAYAYRFAGIKKARLQVLSLSELKALVSRNVAVALLQQYSKENALGHARLVIGFNDFERRLEYVESAKGEVQTIDYSECEKLWAPLFFTALILEN